MGSYTTIYLRDQPHLGAYCSGKIFICQEFIEILQIPNCSSKVPHRWIIDKQLYQEPTSQCTDHLYYNLTSQVTHIEVCLQRYLWHSNYPHNNLHLCHFLLASKFWSFYPLSQPNQTFHQINSLLHSCRQSDTNWILTLSWIHRDQTPQSITCSLHLH